MDDDLSRDIKVLFPWITNAYTTRNGDSIQATFSKCSCQRGNAPKYYVSQEKIRIGGKTIEAARLILVEKVKTAWFAFRQLCRSQCHTINRSPYLPLFCSLGFTKPKMGATNLRRVQQQLPPQSLLQLPICLTWCYPKQPRLQL
jgi:hypothetical protein